MLEPVYSKSPQGVYLYLDDEHKSCNDKFTRMLGYTSPQECVDILYPVSDVAKEDQEKGISAYMEASRKYKAATLEATWVKKDGNKVKTEVTMAPITYRGEVFVLHFISPKYEPTTKILR